MVDEKWMQNWLRGMPSDLSKNPKWLTFQSQT